MSPRTFVSRTAAFIALVALGAACETKTVVQPPPPSPIGVTVSPQSATLTTANQTVQFVALVTGGDATTARTVTWSSSNTAVATVDANGVAKAIANGTASIIAKSTADPTAQGAALVTVNIAPPPVVVPPTVSIAGIFQGNLTTPADLTNLHNTIFVQADADNLTSSGAAAVNFSVTGPGGTKTPCSQAITQGKSAPGQVTTEAATAVSFLCQIKTDSLTSAGVPVFANGNYTITVAVVDASGKQLASSSQAVTFNNTSALNLAVSAAKQALDKGGLQWNGGNLTVTVTPAVFNAQTLTSAVVQVSGFVAGVATTVSKPVTTTGNAPFTVTFRADSTPANNGLIGFESATTTVSVTSAVTTAGSNFTGNLGSSTLRYDDAAPVVTAGPVPTLTNGFFNAAQTFSSACTGTSTATCQQGVTATDGGVDFVTDTIQFSPSTGTAVWTNVTSIATAGNAPAGSLILRAKVCDALGNCTTQASATTFGVDLLPPQFVSVSTPGNINTTMPTITVIAQDTGAAASGFTTGWLWATIVKDSASATGADVTSCVNPVSGALTTPPPSGGCTAATTNSPTPAAFNFALTVPSFVNGYYTETFFAVDLAGNKSAVSVKGPFLVDNAAPTVTVTGINTTVTPPQIAGTAHDNVDLKSVNFREQFTGINAAITGAPATVTSLPFQLATTVKTAFGPPVQGNAALPASGAVLVKGVQAGLGSATIYNLTGLGSDARDQANLYGEGFIPFGQTSTGVNATDMASLTTSAAPTSICQQSTCTGSPTSTTLSAVVLFNAGTTTANPIQTVFFFTIDNTGHAVLVGSTSTFTLTIPTTTNQRTFTYTLPATASSVFTNLGGNTVFAVGVDANGNGVLMGPAITVTTL